jgi:peptidoglycan/LPS O-acetylase OafA/YrhL
MIDKYRPDIDGLRGLAVLLVIGFHLFPNYIRSGYVGVDIFFVISGYLITCIFLKENIGIREFYFNRIKRLYPALLIVLALSTLTSIFILDKASIDNMLSYAISNLLFITNIYSSYDINYFTASIVYKPLIHLWSLSIEWQYYLIFPLIFFLLNKKYINNINIIILIIFILIALWTFSYGYFNSIYRFIQILCGSMLALKSVRIKFISNTYISIVLFLLIILIEFDKTNYPNLYSIIPVLFALNILSSYNSYLNNKILSNSIINYIGKISYPLYLIHWPLISFYNYKFFYNYNFYSKTLIFLLSLIISILIYEFIEKRLRKSISIISLIISTLLLITIFITLIFNNNYLSTNDIKSLDTRSFNINKEWRTNECNLQSDQKDLLYKDLSICLNTINTETKYLLAGDSYAAALYPGIQDLSLNNSFGYLAANSCPLFTEIDSVDLREHCSKINKQRLSFISTYNINTVIMSANWINYTNLEIKLKNIIEELHKKNVKILLVGQFPNWDIPLASALVQNKIEIGSSPIFLNYGFNKKIFKINNDLENLAIANSLKFINPDIYLCNKIRIECMVLLPNNFKIRIITFDNGHLTPSASNYFYTLIKSQL